MSEKKVKLNKKLNTKIILEGNRIVFEKMDEAKINPPKFSFGKLFDKKRGLKTAVSLALIFVVLAGQSLLSMAYEAHVINVTAHICRQAETRTPGFWKTHEEITTQLLPKTLGYEITVVTFEAAFDILDSNAKDMMSKLLSHLLAMKLNIDYYGVGEYYYEGTGETINQIVARADALLCDPESKREDLEEVKDILDYLNNLHELRQCATVSPSVEITSIFVIEEKTDFIQESATDTTGTTTECETGATQQCTLAQPGICAIGTKTCNAEGFWGECMQDDEPIDEICGDGMDNDCDGLADCADSVCTENILCQLPPETQTTTTEEQSTSTEEQPPAPQPECAVDETQTCDTGLLGICSAGVKTCSIEGFWGGCMQSNQPVDEICDNQSDDNCDGLIDCDDILCAENSICQPPVPETPPEEPLEPPLE